MKKDEIIKLANILQQECGDIIIKSVQLTEMVESRAPFLSKSAKEALWGALDGGMMRDIANALDRLSLPELQQQG